MYTCLAELREIRRDLSRRRHNLGNSRLVQGVMALVARAQGCRLHVQLLQKLQPRPVDHLFQCECSDDLKKPHSAQFTVHFS